MNHQTSNSYQTRTLCFDNDISIIELARAFASEPWSFWLDSGDSAHPDCRFDILVFDPLITLTTSINVTKVYDRYNDQLTISQDDPLTLVDQASASVFANNIKEHDSIPFCGGALGYFAYDLGRRYESLPATALMDISLPDMAVGIYSKAIIFDRKQQTYTLVSWHDDIDALAQDIKHKVSSAKTKSITPFSLACDWRANMSQQQYKQKFAQVQQYLLSGDCYQINLAQRFSALYEGDEFDAYLTLRKHNNAPFSAFMRFDDGAILSVSPERFLQIHNQRVETKPIKGTRPRSDIVEFDNAHAKELQNASKDRAENLMIVDLLRNDISKACLPGSVKVPSLFAIESFPAVHHLVSTVEGMLSPNKSATDLLRGAFPGGSITGAPKIRAMQIIEELEPHRRSVYCGSIGYLSACGKMDTSITIRTLVCEQDKIHCWAGGGLVADSKVDSEYQETFDKVAKILPILANNN
ncbi:aminodeoxychorismate synthase component I [Thalassotalea sp. Y01]|uniref:aminodeoxychorismate synthase component I n=1 Tax=Thalassotalea sp. Y01 TaxID=2729613 RepID=UPI00145E33C3|nr:aminodeoxychorismate synthase component I [Thalassotalea sp. Y01]